MIRRNFPDNNLLLYKPRVVWKDEEVKILLKAWKDLLHIIRKLRKGCSKAPLYYAISKEIQKGGFRRSMKEVQFKIGNLSRNYRRAKKELEETGNFTFKFYNEVDDLLKREAEMQDVTNHTTEPEIIHLADQPHILLDGQFIETVDSENPNNVQLIGFAVPESQEVLHSNPPSYTVVSHSEPQVQNEPEFVQVALPQPSSTESKRETTAVPESIFIDFFREFKRSNQQLEKNDASMLELFKEQNDIFRTQTTLLMKLLLK